jgi:hypothetical protein
MMIRSWSLWLVVVALGSVSFAKADSRVTEKLLAFGIYDRAALEEGTRAALKLRLDESDVGLLLTVSTEKLGREQTVKSIVKILAFSAHSGKDELKFEPRRWQNYGKQVIEITTLLKTQSVTASSKKGTLEDPFEYILSRRNLTPSGSKVVKEFIAIEGRLRLRDEAEYAKVKKAAADYAKLLKVAENDVPERLKQARFTEEEIKVSAPLAVKAVEYWADKYLGQLFIGNPSVIEANLTGMMMGAKAFSSENPINVKADYNKELATFYRLCSSNPKSLNAEELNLLLGEEKYVK